MIIKHNNFWLPVGSVTAAAGALLIAGIISSTPKPTAAGAVTAGTILHILTPELHDIDRELRRVGIDPECLAAAGFDAGDTAALLNRAVAHLDITNYTSLRQAMDAHGAAKAEVRRLQRDFRAGTPGEATQRDLDTAIALEASTQARLEARQDDLFDAATEGLSGETIAIIGRIKDQGDLTYPDYYKVTDRTHAQAIALRDALSGVRIETKLGQTPSDHHQAVIAAQLADPAIATAKTSSDTYLDAIITAWEAVLGAE